MERLHTSRPQRFLRTTALILALIFLGISGGITLNHTDDLGPLLHYHAGASTVSHTTAAAAPDSCLACQWENSVFNPQVPAVPIVHLPLTLLPRLSAAVQTRFPQSFTYTSPRAPPRVTS